MTNDTEFPVHKLKALLSNKAGVLGRVMTVLTRMQVNVLSVHADVTENPDISEIVFTFTENNKGETELVSKQLRRQVDVLDVENLTEY